MRYEFRLVNPKTSEEQTITVKISNDQVAAARASADWMTHLQNIARPFVPVGFMFISSAVKPVASA